MREQLDMIAPVLGSIAGLSGVITEEGVMSVVSLCIAIICGITTVVQTAIKAYKAIRRAWLESRIQKSREAEKRND